jgi:hypothetical protein
MRRNESGRGCVGDVGEVALVVVGRGEGLVNRIKNYLFLKNMKIVVDDSFYMIYVNIVFGNC